MFLFIKYGLVLFEYILLNLTSILSKCNNICNNTCKYIYLYLITQQFLTSLQIKTLKGTTIIHNWTYATSIMQFVYQLWHTAISLLAVVILAGKPVVYNILYMEMMWVSHARQKRQILTLIASD